MSDGIDVVTVVVTTLITGTVGLVLAFIKGLFNRSVEANDRQMETDRLAAATALAEMREGVAKALVEMREGVKDILLELRSMHDEQTRQRADIGGLTKDLATLAASAKGAHERIDALVTPMPRRSKNK